MAIDGLETNDAAPACGPQRQRRMPGEDFLASRGMGLGPGEESRAPGIAARGVRGAAGLEARSSPIDGPAWSASNRNVGRTNARSGGAFNTADGGGEE